MQNFTLHHRQHLKVFKLSFASPIWNHWPKLFTSYASVATWAYTSKTNVSSAQVLSYLISSSTAKLFVTSQGFFLSRRKTTRNGLHSWGVRTLPRNESRPIPKTWPTITASQNCLYEFLWTITYTSVRVITTRTDTALYWTKKITLCCPKRKQHRWPFSWHTLPGVDAATFSFY